MSQLQLVTPEFELPGIAQQTLDEVGSGRMDDWPAKRILEWGLDRFAPRIALSASFGSREGMVILDLLHKIDPRRTRVFTIDTGRLPQETYNLMDRVRERYQIEIELYFPKARAVEQMVREKGLNLFYESVENRKLCCAIRKVEPLERALHDLDAWITGLRSEQSRSRARVKAVEVDELHGGRIKLNPLATWSRDQVATYARHHHLPLNALHEAGYPSVGCAPCSRPIEPHEHERAGRWWWEHPDGRECGIHNGYEGDGSGI